MPWRVPPPALVFFSTDSYCYEHPNVFVEECNKTQERSVTVWCHRYSKARLVRHPLSKDRICVCRNAIDRSVRFSTFRPCFTFSYSLTWSLSNANKKRRVSLICAHTSVYYLCRLELLSLFRCPHRQFDSKSLLLSWSRCSTTTADPSSPSSTTTYLATHLCIRFPVNRRSIVIVLNFLWL